MNIRLYKSRRRNLAPISERFRRIDLGAHLGIASAMKWNRLLVGVFLVTHNEPQAGSGELLRRSHCGAVYTATLTSGRERAYAD